jgi:hypothetical protein
MRLDGDRDHAYQRRDGAGQCDVLDAPTKLARFKVPQHVFWVGRDGTIAEWPKTGSGKVLQPGLRRVAEEIVNGVSEPVVWENSSRPARRPREKGRMVA